MIEIGKFMYAGNATFTVRSSKTGNRITFKVTRKKAEKAEKNEDGVSIHPKIWFVKVLTGPDNETAYQFLGTIFGDKDRPRYVHSHKSKIGPHAMSAKVFLWLFNRLHSANGLPKEGIEIFHEGRCGRCGRKLTVPSSIESGFGPECEGKA